MSEKSLPRPPQVTMLGGLVMLGSAFMVLLAFDAMSALGSAETQQRAADFAASARGDGLGLSADQVQTGFRVLYLVTGAAGVTTAVLGWRVLLRERSARLVLSVLAPVLMLAGSVVAPLVAPAVAVAVAMLWTQPARDWFAGIAPPPPPRPAVAQGAAPTQGQAPVPGVPPYPGFPTTSAARPVAEAPLPVLAAVRMTIVSSVVVVIGMLVRIVQVATDFEGHEQDSTEALDSMGFGEEYRLDPAVYVGFEIAMYAVVVVWAAVAVWLAVLVRRGNDAARITLVVSGIIAAVAALTAVLAIWPILVIVTCVSVTRVLLHAETVRWFAEQKRRV